MSDKPVINLTNAAANRLAQLANTNGLIKILDDVYRIGAFNEDHFCDIPKSPTPVLSSAPIEEQMAWMDAMKAWAKAPFPPIITTHKRVDSIKLLLKSAVENGVMGGSGPDRLLLAAFNLKPSDE